MAKEKIIQTDLMKTNESNDIPSNDVFTSYIFSTSNRSLSKYGERLLMEVISVAQEYTIDAALGIKKLDFGEKYSEKFAVIDIPVKSLLNADDSSNYTKAKEAAVELMKIYHTVESPVLDDEGNPKRYSDGSLQYKFASYHLLDNVTVNHKPGIVSVKLGAETWSQILDMGKGYTRYNLLTAKTLDDVAAIRLFQLLSNCSEPLYFSLERIKGILGLQDKYKNNPTGFLRRVIDPAESEIREKCPFAVEHDITFDSSKKGRPSIVGITFRKVLKPSIIKDPTTVLDSSIINLLVKTYGFDERGLRSNLKLFSSAEQAGVDLLSFLKKIEPKAKAANSPQGYVVRSLQNLMENTGNASAKTKPELDANVGPKRKKSEPIAAAVLKGRRVSRKRLAVNDAAAFEDQGLDEL